MGGTVFTDLGIVEDITVAHGGVLKNFNELCKVMPTGARRHVPVNDDAVVPQEIIEDLQRVAPPGSTSQQQTLLALQEPVTFFSGVSGLKDSCDASLFRLQAPLLQGMTVDAYLLLAKLVKRFSWDQLLKLRSTVFVMEEYGARCGSTYLKNVFNTIAPQ